MVFRRIVIAMLTSTPEAMSKFVSSEMARWSRVVKDHDIRAD